MVKKNPILPRFLVFLVCFIFPSALHSSDEEIRARVSVLVNELEDTYAPVYQEKAKAELVGMGALAAPALRGFMSEDKPDITLKILDIIAEAGGPGAARAVLSFLEKAEDFSLVSRSVETLGKLKDPEALPKLISVLKGSSENFFFDAEGQAVAGMAIWSLGELGDPQCVPEILGFVKVNPQPPYLICAADALGKIGDASTGPFLLDLLKYQDPDVRYSAARALSRIVDPSMGRALWTAFQNEQDPKIRTELVGLLSDIGGEPLTRKFVSMLAAGQKYEDQNMAEKGLRRIGRPAIPALVAALDQAGSEQKINIARILSGMKAPEALPSLLKIALDKDPSVQVAVVDVLSRCGDKTSLDVLKRLSRSSDKRVKEAARAARQAVLLRIKAVEGGKH